MPNFFMAFYQNDIVMEDAFMAWREDTTNRTPGKEKTLQQTEKFFDYLACVLRARARRRAHARARTHARAAFCPSVTPPPSPCAASPRPRTRSDDEEDEDDDDEPAMEGVPRPQNAARLP